MPQISSAVLQCVVHGLMEAVGRLQRPAAQRRPVGSHLADHGHQRKRQIGIKVLLPAVENGVSWTALAAGNETF